jgi:hypothetical protein
LDETVVKRSVPTAFSDGSRYIAFVDAYLGSPDDLWISEVGTGESFLSLFLGRLEGAGRETASLALREIDGGVELSIAGENLSPLKIGWTRARLDSDGDGIPDLAEDRMSLDPLLPDTDGDGLNDALDPAPNARTEPEQTPEQIEDSEIQLALFRQFFMFGDEDTRGLAVIHAPLEWRGRNDPTIALDRGELERFNETVGFNGATRVRIEPLGHDLDQDPPVFGSSKSALRDNERLYSLILFKGPLHAVGYRVLVCRLGGRWLIRELDVVFVA